MTKEIEIIHRLDRLIELIENMTTTESQSIKKELKELNEWRIETNAKNKTKNGLLEMIRWFGPWGLAFLYVLFNHKLG